jgi:hypothetical protein
LQFATAAAAADHDACACDEGPEVEGLVVKDSSALGISRVVQLESAIEAISIDEIGAHAPAHSV